jgi:hypothetical protein
MKKLPYFLFSLAFLFSCQKESAEDGMYKIEVQNQVNDFVQLSITSLLVDMQRMVKQSGNDQEEIRHLNHSKRVASWRENYLNQPNNQNLLAYSDSVLQLHSLLNLPATRKGTDKIVLEEIGKYKQQLSKSDDDFAHTQLLFWTIKGEMDFHRDNASFLGASHHDYFGGIVQAVFNDRKITLGNSIYLILRIPPNQECNENGFLVKPHNFILKHDNSKEEQVLTPIKIGSQHLFYYIPDKSGNYTIKGKLTLDTVGTEVDRAKTIVFSEKFNVL